MKFWLLYLSVTLLTLAISGKPHVTNTPVSNAVTNESTVSPENTTAITPAQNKVEPNVTTTLSSNVNGSTKLSNVTASVSKVQGSSSTEVTKAPTTQSHVSAASTDSKKVADNSHNSGLQLAAAKTPLPSKVPAAANAKPKEAAANAPKQNIIKPHQYVKKIASMKVKGPTHAKGIPPVNPKPGHLMKPHPILKHRKLVLIQIVKEKFDKKYACHFESAAKKLKISRGCPTFILNAKQVTCDGFKLNVTYYGAPATYTFCNYSFGNVLEPDFVDVAVENSCYPDLGRKVGRCFPGWNCEGGPLGVTYNNKHRELKYCTKKGTTFNPLEVFGKNVPLKRHGKLSAAKPNLPGAKPKS